MMFWATLFWCWSLVLAGFLAGLLWAERGNPRDEGEGGGDER